MKIQNSPALVISLAAIVSLGGCGGSGHSTPTAATPDPAPTAQVPATANFSVVGFVSYLNSLLKSAADTLEPVSVSAVTPPTDDTLEPASIN